MKGFLKFLGAAALIGVGVHFVKKRFSSESEQEADILLQDDEKTLPKAADTEKTHANEARITVIKTDEEGRNTDFRDNETGEEMTREQFVKKIEDGVYSDYYVRGINGIETPVSKPDAENLG